MEVPANTAQETPVLAVDGIMVICSDGQLYIYADLEIQKDGQILETEKHRVTRE
jgi:hypothetical protein